jgi:hypothetical protein
MMKLEEEMILQLIAVILKVVMFALQILRYKQTPWPLVRERTIPTDRPPLVDEI